eukprot:scaffold1583_cov299-Pinguiococcus_pyrenoidosus.AAC.10
MQRRSRSWRSFRRRSCGDVDLGKMMTWFWGGYDDEEPQTGEDPPEGEEIEGLTTRRFYLNILVLNKEEVVRNVVEQKQLESSQVAARFPRLRGLQKVAGRIANRKVIGAECDEESKWRRRHQAFSVSFCNQLSVEAFLLKVGEKLASIMPVRMAEKGIKVACAPRFIQKNLIVVELRVLAVDQEELMNVQETREQLEGINNIVSSLAYISSSLSGFVASRVDEKLLVKIEAKLFETIPIVLAERMEEKAGLKVEACTKRDVDQAAWFYDCLQQIGAPSSPNIVLEEVKDEEEAQSAAAPKAAS